MPQPKFKSRTYRRISTKLPGGNSKIHYEKRKPELPKCANCKKELKGIPKLRDYKMRRLGISKKRPERAFGGYLCSECSRQTIKKEARA